MSVSDAWKRVMTVSVTNESRASTSLVMREISTPAGRRAGWRRGRRRLRHQRAAAGLRRALCARFFSSPWSQPRHLALWLVAREEDLVGQALLDDLAVQLGLLEERVEVAGGHQLVV